MDRFDDEIETLLKDVIGAAIEVHRLLGPGHPENVYGSALAAEFLLRGIPFEREHPYAVVYKEERVGEGRLDFWVGKRLVVEIKAVESLSDAHIGQVVAYLSQKGEPLGLLINFNVSVLKNGGIRRVIRSKLR